MWCTIKEHSEVVYFCILCKITCHHHFYMPDQCCTWWVLQCSLNAEMVCAFTCNQSFFVIWLHSYFYVQMFGILLILGIGKLLKIVDIPDPSWGQIKKVKGWLSNKSSLFTEHFNCYCTIALYLGHLLKHFSNKQRRYKANWMEVFM